MSESQAYTAEQFLDARGDLPEGGRWTELERGRVITLDPPDVEHGTIVLNISKVLSEYFQNVDQGYACFDLGLLVKRGPDTVRFPAISLFKTGERFAETDREISERKPAALFEVASTNARRQLIKEHVDEFVSWGVELIWVVDPQKQEVLQFQPGKGSQVFDAEGTIDGSSLLAGFGMSVKAMFAEPEWWK